MIWIWIHFVIGCFLTGFICGQRKLIKDKKDVEEKSKKENKEEFQP